MSIQALANALDWEKRHEQGAEWEGRQAARMPALQALRPTISEEEWHAGRRAIRECAPSLKDMPQTHDDAPVDGSAAGDYGMCGKMTAFQVLENLRQSVRRQLGKEQVIAVDWLIRMRTLPEIAWERGEVRLTGGNRLTVETRPARRIMRAVLKAIEAYYAGCDQDKGAWARQCGTTQAESFSR